MDESEDNFVVWVARFWVARFFCPWTLEVKFTDSSFSLNKLRAWTLEDKFTGSSCSLNELRAVVLVDEVLAER